jgi:hypothetical protein
MSRETGHRDPMLGAFGLVALCSLLAGCSSGADIFGARTHAETIGDALARNLGLQEIACADSVFPDFIIYPPEGTADDTDVGAQVCLRQDSDEMGAQDIDPVLETLRALFPDIHAHPELGTACREGSTTCCLWLEASELGDYTLQVVQTEYVWDDLGDPRYVLDDPSFDGLDILIDVFVRPEWTGEFNPDASPSS